MTRRWALGKSLHISFNKIGKRITKKSGYAFLDGHLTFRDTQQEGKFTTFQSKMNKISLVTTPKQVATHDKWV